MATFIGPDRNGMSAELIDNSQDLMPITLKEAELLKAVRMIQDMRRRKPRGKSDEEQLALAVEIAYEHLLTF